MSLGCWVCRCQSVQLPRTPPPFHLAFRLSGCAVSRAAFHSGRRGSSTELVYDEFVVHMVALEQATLLALTAPQLHSYLFRCCRTLCSRLTTSVSEPQRIGHFMLKNAWSHCSRNRFCLLTENIFLDDFLIPPLCVICVCFGMYAA